MKKMLQEIHKGRNLKRNIPRYVETAIPVYADYGMLELTFSAYMFVEEITEEKKELAEKEREFVDAVLIALYDLSREDCNHRELAHVMDKLRGKITKKMDYLTACTDRMICYEYVLNRMEMRYLTEKELDKKLSVFDEQTFLESLNAYLFGDRDSSVMQDKIRMVMGQVPVHMTKGKLFERIGETFTLYKEQDKSALDHLIYMIRTAAMLYQPVDCDGYPSLEKCLHHLQNADYEHMEKDTYDELVSVLEAGAREIHELTDFYYGMQKVVNGVYAVCLTVPYCKTESKLMAAGRSIWRCLAKREYRAEMMMPLEGRIEKCVEDSSYLESVFYEIRNSYQEELKELDLTQFFEDFTLVTNLLSDSLFIDLAHVGEEEKADADYVKRCTDDLLEELEEHYKKLSRPVRRAVTGLILDKLPLPFQSAKEVQEYLVTNLMGCSDKAEKCVVLTLLQDLMQEEKGRS